jgi:protein arginine N-methyltransferase 1
VYAVEASGLAVILTDVVAANGYSGVVSVFHGLVEDVTLPERVDVLVSEWLGFHLLHESMLDSVVAARDKWLKVGGLMLPCCARIMAAPVCLDDWVNDQLGFWSSVDGLDMSAFAPHVAEAALQAPLVTLLQPGQLLAQPREVAVIDCCSVTVSDLSEVGGQRLCFLSDKTATVHGYAIWFSVEFPETECLLSNAPGLPATHWQQSVVLLPDMLAATAGQTRLDARIVLRKDAASPRDCEIEVELLPID